MKLKVILSYERAGRAIVDMCISSVRAEIKECPKCGSSVLGRDEDGLFCLCGWHEPGKMPTDAEVRKVSRVNHEDKGCKYATQRIRKEAGNRRMKSKCIECPYPLCIYER